MPDIAQMSRAIRRATGPVNTRAAGKSSNSLPQMQQTRLAQGLIRVPHCGHVSWVSLRCWPCTLSVIPVIEARRLTLHNEKLKRAARKDAVAREAAIDPRAASEYKTIASTL